METLTKENFWNALQEKYPAGMKIFCDWIDGYKKNSSWYFLIGKDVKYHHLPYAMQIGIWLQFEREMNTQGNKPFYYNHAKKHITNFIKDLHQESTD